MSPNLDPFANLFLVELECGQRGVVAARALAAGEIIVEISGREVSTPSRYTLQVSETVHVMPPETNGTGHVQATEVWKYINHHCAPNAFVRDRAMFALRDIAPGEEINFNYNSTELDIASPFECWCDAEGREERHLVRGFQYLSERERAEIAHYVASHLLPRLAVV